MCIVVDGRPCALMESLVPHDGGAVGDCRYKVWHGLNGTAHRLKFSDGCRGLRFPRSKDVCKVGVVGKAPNEELDGGAF